MNDTIYKFNYPSSLIKEYDYWVVLIRPKQVTLGSLVLALKGDSTSFANMSKSKFSELDIVFKDIELSLKKCFQFNKIKYLALRMVDRNPHFHVIPRYSKSFNFAGKKYYDNSWPSPPDLSNSIKLSDKEFSFLHEFILKNWSNE